MRKMMFFVAAAVAAAVMAQNASESSAMRRRRLFVESGGGRLLAPVDGMVVRFVDGQGDVPRQVLKDAAKSIGTTLSIPVEVVAGDSVAGAFADGKAKVVVLLDGRDDAPPVLAAPESGWAVVGVKNLKEGNPSEQVLHSRIRKEVWRAFAYALGVGHESVPSVLRPVYSVDELEALDTECPSPVSLDAISGCVAKRGIRRLRYASYRRACEEGWAPAPTNDVQRAIWEQVKADKERGPTNPIKIEPPGKKK